jgi:carbon-monoxide dehydrogenase large subunit
MPDDHGGSHSFRTSRPILVGDRVRCVGDRVAFVIAETVAQACDAAELIEIEYEPLTITTDLEAAVKDDAFRIWDDCPTGNISFEFAYGDKAATDAAFSRAKHVVGLRLENNRVTANSLEPRAAIGVFDFSDDSYTLYTSSQNPHGVRSLAARQVLHVPETKIRVIAPDVGGGFGLKSNAHVEDPLVLWAARRCGRPVKWTATRSEAMLGDYQGRGQIVHGEMALDENGKILGIRARALHAVGAYTSAVCAAPICFSLQYIPNVYDVQTVDLRTQAVFTNTAAVTAYRGTGRPEAIYLVERLIDEAAIKTGIDPVEIRRRNLISPPAIPYRTATGVVYDSGEFERVLDKCLHLADWQGFAARRAESEKKAKRRGRGLSYYIEPAGHDNERMELRFDPGGTITIVAGTHSHGQGHATTYAQMISDWLGVPFDDIRFVQGDTDKVAFGRGTFGARSSMNGGAALRGAADAIIAKAKLMAAALMEADSADIQFAEGQFRIIGTDRVLSLVEVSKAFYYPGGITDKFGVGLEGSGTYGTNPPNNPNGCHICEVEVDPDTGETTIERYTVIDDAGRVINPLICEGQIHGGVAQGIGQALMEQVVYDRESGQNLSASFMDYAMPRAHDLPSFVTGFEEIPCTTNPLGVKGIGEAGAIGTPPAIINALLDALRPLGVSHIEMPATPMRVWYAISRAKRIILRGPRIIAVAVNR